MTDDTNSLLVGDFTRQGVEIALKQMTHLKVTRPNGMPPIFFQFYWSNIGDDVS